MNDFNWRNKPRTTTNHKKVNVVTDPLPITFNGSTRLSSAENRPPNARIYKPKPKDTP